ncbi:MAG TPA: hypothetical protein VMY36_00545 [Patescibacteria group bacterium]|nr:hypothetical protein [Patescibacteria group bacterium]
MRKINLPALIIILVIALALGQLLLTHRLATDGEMVKEFELNAARLEDKNEILRQEITQLGSLREVAQKAEKLGFVHNSHLLHLTPELPVAMNY